MKNKYFYVACEAGASANIGYRHYFRLYTIDKERAKLVDQGLADKVDGWVQKYNATMELTNPYPELD